MSTTRTFAIVNTSSTFDKFAGKEALDAALILASYEMEVALFFIGDGVYQTQLNQNAELINSKDYLATFNALGFYDIDNIYISESCLLERGLSKETIFSQAKLLDKDQLSALFKHYDRVLTF